MKVIQITLWKFDIFFQNCQWTKMANQFVSLHILCNKNWNDRKYQNFLLYLLHMEWSVLCGIPRRKVCVDSNPFLSYLGLSLKNLYCTELLPKFIASFIVFVLLANFWYNWIILNSSLWQKSWGYQHCWIKIK